MDEIPNRFGPKLVVLHRFIPFSNMYFSCKRMYDVVILTRDHLKLNDGYYHLKRPATAFHKNCGNLRKRRRGSAKL